MSIRTAIAGALVELGLIDKDEQSEPRGVLIVDSIVEAIARDSHFEDFLLREMVSAATDPFWEGTAARTRPASSVIKRLREQGIVITLDREGGPNDS